MQIGILAKTFVRPTVQQNLDAVSDHGLGCVQYNLVCAGLPTLPDAVDAQVCATIRKEMTARGIKMAAVSGTFNIIHPDKRLLDQSMRRLGVLASACAALGTSLITLCAGTCDPDDMWRHHPDNDGPGAWRDLLASMQRIVAIAEEHQVNVAVEPEINNVVSSAPNARRLLDEIGSPRLRIVLDGANLLTLSNADDMPDVLAEACDLLGPQITIAHAKDVVITNGQIQHVAAGAGVLDYENYVTRLRGCGFDGPLVLHGLKESEVAGSLAYVHERLGSTSGSMTVRESPGGQPASPPS